MANKTRIEFEGFEEVLKRLAELNGDTKKITEKALKKSFEYSTRLAEEAVAKPNLPAGGEYSHGNTEKSLKRTPQIEWQGTLASVSVGFDIAHGGLPSIFMMYGTPRYMKNQKMYNAFFGKKTRDAIKEIQEDIFYKEIRRLEG